MTSQEEQMLKALIERVNGTKLTEKDVDAENLLAKGFSSNPDAVYILAQSVLVQNIALEQARGQLEQAKQQIEELKKQPAKSGGFLGGLLGHHDKPQQQSTQQPTGQAANPQGYQQVYNPQASEYQAPYQGSYPPQGAYQQAAYQPPPPPAYGYAPPPPPVYGVPMGGPPIGGYYGAPMGAGSSFLRGAAQTAAGVAAGALAFEGVEALLHGGFGHPGYGMGMGGWGMPGVGFGMGPGMGMGFERPVEETVINNYYDSPGGGYEHEREHYHESMDSGGAQLSDAGWQTDSGSGPNDGFDNSSFDSGDSGGGWDSSGSDFGSDSGNFGDDGTI